MSSLHVHVWSGSGAAEVTIAGSLSVLYPIWDPDAGQLILDARCRPDLRVRLILTAGEAHTFWQLLRREWTAGRPDRL